MAKRSVIIKRLRAEREALQEKLSEAMKGVDPLRKTVEERSKDLESARYHLKEADELFRGLQHKSGTEISNLEAQLRLASVQREELEAQLKKTNGQLADLQSKYDTLEIAKGVLLAELQKATRRAENLEKQELNTAKIRRRLNNAHEYIGKLAKALRDNNIKVPTETVGSWASTTSNAEEKEDLDLLASAAADKKDTQVTELHPPKDFYTQAGQ